MPSASESPRAWRMSIAESRSISGAGLRQQRRGAGLLQAALHARVGFAGERRIEGRERGGVAGLEHRIGGVAAGGGVGGEQVQTAEGGVDRAAHPVVDAHGLEAVGAHGGAGTGVGHRGAVLDGERLVVRAVEQAVVGERTQDRPGLGIAAGGERRDAGLDVGIAVAGEPGIGGVGPGLRGGGQGPDGAPGDEEKDEAAAHSVSVRGRRMYLPRETRRRWWRPSCWAPAPFPDDWNEVEGDPGSSTRRREASARLQRRSLQSRFAALLLLDPGSPSAGAAVVRERGARRHPLAASPLPGERPIVRRLTRRRTSSSGCCSCRT